jgi:hypothetical protein
VIVHSLATNCPFLGTKGMPESRLKKYSPAYIFLLHAGADLVFFKSELVEIPATPAPSFAQEDNGTN